MSSFDYSPIISGAIVVALAQRNQREFFGESPWTGIPGGSMQIDVQTRKSI